MRIVGDGGKVVGRVGRSGEEQSHTLDTCRALVAVAHAEMRLGGWWDVVGDRGSLAVGWRLVVARCLARIVPPLPRLCLRPEGSGGRLAGGWGAVRRLAGEWERVEWSGDETTRLPDHTTRLLR